MLDFRMTGACGPSRVMVTAALAAVAGCAPRTGPPPAPALPPILMQDCDVSFDRSLTFDQPTPLGFSALESLQQLGGERRSALAWLDAPASEQYLLEYGPERGGSELTLGIQAAEGEILYRSALPAPWAAEGTDCGPDALLIPIFVTLQSAGGALAEAFLSTLEVTTPHQGRFSHALPPKAMRGGLMVSEPEALTRDRAYDVQWLQLDVLLWRGGSHGVLGAEISGTASTPSKELAPAPTRARHELAVWPSPLPCPDGFRALPSDAELVGFSPRDVLAELSATKVEDLRWSDGTTTTLELAPPHSAADELCVASVDGLEFDTTLLAQTGDARIRTEVVVRVRAEPGANGPGEITISTRDAGAPPVSSGEGRDEVSDAVRPNAGSSVAPKADDLELDASYWDGSATGLVELRTRTAATAAQSAPVLEGRWSR